ncbi:TPA: phospholipase [Stenotrophomonas maltophilia]|nr:phospholipase [Stenotrophomonas maltophilia]HDS1025685.1 phospholipase [Stenotrophomonas maltophilia]HDS1029779.1 phospholipase [Stenotrophomonas maltophilia]HDS1033721.1 phospholipase [Stenotrophomonas maltophilia]
MTDHDIEARVRAVQKERELVDQLRASGNDKQADRLQETYHAREMSGLASDVYQSARHSGEPPTGWTRASTDPAALRAAGIDLTDDTIREMLQPPESGFRAEIYIPDKRVFGDDAKPVVVYKGSTGEIVDPLAPNGKRESGGEDFLNNGQQGIGMRSDYYDRAMRLASIVNQERPGGFEIAGHSLGGGMASAASAVTGARATTFNAAGLHPATPSRYAKDNGLPTFDTQQTVHTYQTTGEVLNDVQNGMHRLSEQQRRGYGLLANELGMVLKDPVMQKVVGEKLREMLPPGAQTAAAQFIEQLATQPGQQALRDVPLAAGRLELLLEARTRDAQGVLVDRPHTAAPSQVAELAGPISAVLHSTAAGMHIGRRAGEQVEKAGAVAAQVLDRTGDGVERVLKTEGMAIGQVVNMGTASLQVSTRAASTVIASGRELTGSIEATAHRVHSQAGAGGLSALSWVAGHIGMDKVADKLTRQAEAVRDQGEQHAQHATKQAHADAVGVRATGDRVAAAINHDGQWVAGKLQNGFATAGAHVDRGYDFMASHVKGITATAPVTLATVGGATAGVVTAAATHVPTGNLPQDIVKLHNLDQSARVVRGIGAAFSEATARHGMDPTVIPSLDSALISQEAAARKLIEQQPSMTPAGDGRPASHTPEPAPRATGIDHPSHAGNPLFLGAQAGVHALDRAHNRVPDLQSDQLAGALAAQAKREGLETISHVVLSDDHARAFAVDTADLNAPHRRHAHVEVAQGMAQPLAVSTAQVDVLVATRSAAVEQGLAQQQVQESQEQARRMA